MLDPNHPIFHNILAAGEGCYITIYDKDGYLYYRYVAPSTSKYPIDTGSSLGYTSTTDRADQLLKTYPIYMSKIYGPPESPISLKIRVMDLRYKKRYELNRSR